MSGTINSAPTRSGAAPVASASSTYPPCAAQCLSAATASLPCEASDSRCLCLHASNVHNSVVTCLGKSSSCSSLDAQSAANYYNTLCAELDLPTTSLSPDATAPIATATGAPTSLASVSTTVASSAAASTSSTSSSKPLSVPTIAGIAAGCAFLVAALITAAIFVYIRRQSPKRPSDRDSEKPPSYSSHTPSAGAGIPNRKRKTSTSSTHSTASTVSHLARHKKRYPKYSSRHISVSSMKDLESQSQPLPETTAAPLPTPTPFTTNNNKAPSTTTTELKPLPIPQPTRSDSPLTKARFAFGAKAAAEASVTSLSIPISSAKRISVSCASPAATEFADVGSVYSATSSFRDSQPTSPTTSRPISPLSSSRPASQHTSLPNFSRPVSRPASIYHTTNSRPFSPGSERPFSPEQSAELQRGLNRIQLERTQSDRASFTRPVSAYSNTSDFMALMGCEVLSDTAAAAFPSPPLPKPKKAKHGQRHDTFQAMYPQAVLQQKAQQRSAPVNRAPTKAKPAPLKLEKEEASLVERRKSLVAMNPLAQNPSPSASTFNFEVPSPSSIPEFRQSMMGRLNFDFDEIMDCKKQESESK